MEGSGTLIIGAFDCGFRKVDKSGFHHIILHSAPWPVFEAVERELRT